MIDALTTIFSNEQINKATELYNELSTKQRLWLSGYLTGLNNSGTLLNEAITPTNTTDTNTTSPALRLTIIYGTHSGNSKFVAEQASKLAQTKGIEVTLTSIQEYQYKKIKDVENLLIVISTHGEGVPPASAEDFHSYIFGRKAPNINNQNLSVIALGDSSYINFCQSGKDIFNQLIKLGANEVHPLIELDVDYKEHLDVILPDLITRYTNTIRKTKSNAEKTSPKPNGATTNNDDRWEKVEVLEKILLNGKGSNKETYHIELDIENTNINYSPGDALEIKASNNDELVYSILNKIKLTGKEEVEINKKKLTTYEALKSNFEITKITPLTLKKYATLIKNEQLNDILNDKEQLANFIYGTDLLDLLTKYPIQVNFTDLAATLRQLPPRLYSISSSQEYTTDELHITVSAVRYNINERNRNGVCSGYLADEINIGDYAYVKIKRNEGFRLPTKSDHIIMIGAGTGIAPFRSFLQQRKTDKANGKSWLFFGEQHFNTDFLYQTELLDHHKKGLITRFDIAFSRDQEEKIYVQDRLRENGALIHQWINDGAYVYICGDMNKMAKDVKNELIAIQQLHGNKSKEEASSFLKQLATKGKLQEDVY